MHMEKRDDKIGGLAEIEKIAWITRLQRSESVRKGWKEGDRIAI